MPSHALQYHITRPQIQSCEKSLKFHPFPTCLYMVSLQEASILSQEKMKASTGPEGPPISKKRKWFGDEDDGVGKDSESKLLKRAEMVDRSFDVELHLDSPLPLEWQRCLDIKSGQIHYYNTRTQTRTSTDPRISPEEPPRARPTLDLELNLACEPTRTTTASDRCNSALGRSLSWVSFDIVGHEEEEEEMVAAVCMRCHMLVMMCKAAPSCPNCKFVHPPKEGTELVKQGFRLLCCKD